MLRPLLDVVFPPTLGRIGNGNPVARLFLVTIDFLGYRIHRAANEAIVILAAPLSGMNGQVGRALKAGEDLLGQQFVGRQRRLPFDPVIRHNQEAAKAT